MVTFRTATADDFEAVRRLINGVFLNHPEDADDEAERRLFEPERAIVACDGDEVVGHAGTFSRELTVPGAVIAAAFVTAVGVAATHRRQGIATTMLCRQLQEVRERGESVALLWASEGAIYPRYGYGLATQRVSFDVDSGAVRLTKTPSDTHRLRVGSPQDVRSELIKVYDDEWSTRPGFASRDERWWDYRLADPASQRGGAGPLQALICEGKSGVEGYALYRTRSQWESAGPNGEVKITELIAATPTAYQAMWRFMLEIDLTRHAQLWFGAVDEPILHLVNEPRRLGAKVGDGLWARIVNVPAALAARRYAAPVDVVLEVTDPLLPDNAGRFLLRGSSDLASCEPTTEPADLQLDVSTLAALYLGGNWLGSLAAAGLVEELRPGAVAATDAAFHWQRAPVGIEMF
jgi:predicted acetyltransferase